MFKNYIKLAFRHLKKQKLYSFINILGLSVGLAFCILVMLFVQDEMTYDRYHENEDRIYRMYRESFVSESENDFDLYMPIPVAPAMKQDFPQIEEVTRITPSAPVIIQVENGQLMEQGEIAYADPSIFRIFSFPFISGSASSALRNPDSAVLSKELSMKLFGSQDVIGRELRIRLNGEFHVVEVTGVMETIPANSTLQFELLLPHQKLMQVNEAYTRAENRWDATRLVTYVMLREGESVTSIRERMPEFMTAHMGDIFREMRELGMVEGDALPSIYRLQPMSEIHLNPDVPGAFAEPSDPVYSAILGGIGLSILMIACINFMLLAIARSSGRAREVGLRKVVGADRKQLITQFWGEAFLLTLFAFLLGILLAEMVLPVFNELSQKEITIRSLFESSAMMGGLLVLFIVTAFAAGSYPAILLSGFKPVESLKRKVKLGGSNPFSKSLIVVQFSLSVTLIIATLVMANQLEFLQNKHLGFEDEQVVVVSLSGLDGERVLDLYQNELENESDIVSITGANASFATGLWRRGFRLNDQTHQAAIFRVDYNYIETLQMNLLQGRNFDPNLSSDSTNSIIVNEALVQELGFQDDPIGQVLPVDWGFMINPTIIGVVEDFNYQSLESEVAPAMMYVNPGDPILNMFVRVQPTQLQATIGKLRDTWTQITNDIPFSYSFLDQDMDQLYQAEERWSTIVKTASAFAIFIACLGLFGLAGIMAVRRQKEIGVRKVLGASLSSVIGLISKDFAILVALSITIAVPLAWYLMNSWLQNFAYRIDLGVGIFLAAAAIAMSIALLTVGWQAVKAARMDPVDSLRSE